MKIVFVIDVYDLMSNGTVVTACRFADELKKKGHTVRVVGTGAKGEDCFEIPERYIPLVTEVSRLSQIRFGKPDRETLVNAFSDADVIHCFLPFKLEKKARKIAKKMDIPVTAAFHLQPENVTYNMGLKHSRLVPRFLYAAFRNRFYKNFDHIHCPSMFIAEQLKKHKYKAELHVISNGVDRDFVPLPDKKPASDDRFDILMIGRYANEKRQDVLIKAISLSKYADRIHLTLAGHGPKQRRYQRLSEKYLKNPVTFAFFTKDKLIERIHQSDLYVHAADVEIEAIACIEACACGLVPVISDSAKSATPQFALDERSLFKHGDAKDLANKIDYWIEHPEERAAASDRYAELGKLYSIDFSVKKAEEMFSDAVYSHREKKKLQTKKYRKKSRKLVKKSKIIRFFSWLVYYFIATPVMFLYLKLVYGLKIRGRRNLKKVKKSGAISVSNHVHLLDCAMCALAMSPRKVIFTALKSNFKIPIAGAFLHLLGAIPVPPEVTDFRVFKNEVDKALKKRRIVHIYAEGHLINYYAGLRGFERGAFYLSSECQKPILPVVVSWRKRRGLNRLVLRGKPCATVTIGTPVQPNYILLKKEMAADLQTRVRAEMRRVYEQSNHGDNFDYFEGKPSPEEYHTRKEKKLLADETRSDPNE